MRKLTGTVILISLFLINGCNSSSEKSVNIDYSKIQLAPMKDSPLTTTSATRFGEYLKNGIRYRLTNPVSDIVLAETAADGSVGASSFSTTNVHEIGVDEADSLKYDGQYLYAVEHSTFSNTNNSIRILETNSDLATATEISKIIIDSDELRLSDIFLLNNEKLLVSISNTQYYLWDALLIDADWSWASGKTQIQLFDVADPIVPEQQWKIEIEGNLEGSRRIGNTLYLVTRYIPNLDNINYSAISDEEKIANERLILATPISDLLPHYQSNDGAIRSLVNAQDCLLPQNNLSNEGYADVITLSAINLSTKQIESSICMNTNVQGIYSSTSGFYIGGSSNTPLQEFSNFTEIHKFKIDAGNISYRASKAIAGQLGWSEPSFRMSEHNDDLRIVTTDFNSQTFAPEHYLTVLRDDGSNDLQTLAMLPNDSNPAAIGKPGEDIFSVRFTDDRAYIVTFERIDPLYVIDLSNPVEPVIAGELEIPGFSRYLHPLSDDWLLGIGSEVDNNVIKGVKVELYDIRDITSPVVASKLVFGDRWSSTEATVDLRSISLLGVNDDQKRLAIPMQIWQPNAQTGTPSWQESALHLFELNGFVNNNLELEFSGKMISESSTEEQRYPMFNGPNRSRLDPNAVFYKHGNSIWSALWGDWEQLNGPY